jgi:hypothetical protein
MIDGLCTDSRWLGILTWALIPFYAVLFGLIALGLRARGKPVRVFPMLLGVAVVLGALVYFRHKENAYFQDLSVGPGGVELRYFWPKSPLVIPAKDVEAVGLVRGRHFRKGSRVDDRVWIKVRTGGVTQTSCESKDVASMATAMRDLASKVGKTPSWQERCPDENKGVWVTSTEAEVTAAGKMSVPAACASAAPLSSGQSRGKGF